MAISNKNTKKRSRKIKKILFVGQAIIYVGILGWLGWHYISLAPERSASSFISDISTSNDLTTAYSQTTSDYRSNVSTSAFAAYFEPLGGTRAKYTVLGQVVSGNYALVGGVIKDLSGVNYNYNFRMLKQSNHWLVDAVYFNKQ